VLVRQYDRFATEWDLEIWDDAAARWVLKKHCGDPTERLESKRNSGIYGETGTKVVSFTAPAQTGS